MSRKSPYIRTESIDAEETRDKISSEALLERAISLAEEISDEERFSVNMWDFLSNYTDLQLVYIQNYLGYSVSERRDISGLLREVSGLYDTQLQFVRHKVYERFAEIRGDEK